MELDQKQFDMIMTELKKIGKIEKELTRFDKIEKELTRFDKIEKELTRFDKIEKELTRFDTIEKELTRFDTIEKDIKDIKEEQRQMKKEQKQMKKIQQNMILQMMQGFGKINRTLEDNIEIIQRQIEDNKLKEEKRYQKQYKLNERLEANVVRLENLSVRNLQKHDLYDEILHIDHKPHCV